MGEIVPGARKIAVLRANGLGDFIFALPALDALRRAYPEAEIFLLGKPWHAEFLSARSSPVDRVAVVPPYPGVRDDLPEDAAELEEFFRHMASEGFDLALQMQGGGRNSNPFLLRFGAGMTAGLRTPDAPELDRWVPYVYFQNEILRYLEVVSLVGAEPVDLAPRVEVTDRDVEEARQLVGQADQLVLLHPGAGFPDRRWNPDNFAAVGDAAARAGARVVVIGTAAEAEFGRAVVQGMTCPALDLTGHSSLSGLAGLCSMASVLVGNDSGPLHLAQAVGAATVGIFWCFNALTAGLPFRAQHRPHISWRTACPVCGADRARRQRCEHRPSFVDDIPVEPVIQSALELLCVPRLVSTR